MTPTRDDLAEFAGRHLVSRDVDPVYPVLRKIEEDDPEGAFHRSLLYIAYYNLGASETAWECYGHNFLALSRDGQMLRLPTGTERRAHRDPARLAHHLKALAASRPGDYLWTRSARPDEAWRSLVAWAEGIWGNGRWASYKTAEVLWKVNGLRVRATDMGNDGSSGPRAGLRLFGKAGTVEEADRIGDELLADLRARGIQIEIEELETVLCDFASMVKGRYYVGHDIDLMLEQLRDERISRSAAGRILRARRETLPHEYLGELQGWRGRDVRLARRYAETGEIGDRATSAITA